MLGRAKPCCAVGARAGRAVCAVGVGIMMGRTGWNGMLNAHSPMAPARNTRRLICPLKSVRPTGGVPARETCTWARQPVEQVGTAAIVFCCLTWLRRCFDGRRFKVLLVRNSAVATVTWTTVEPTRADSLANEQPGNGRPKAAQDRSNSVSISTSLSFPRERKREGGLAGAILLHLLDP